MEVWLRKPAMRHRPAEGPTIARLAPGQSIEDAQTQLAVLNAQLAPSDPQGRSATENNFHTRVVSLHEDHVRAVKPVLVLLQAGVLCLLLIGVVNLACLLLIRASGQMKAIAVRMALGATRARISAQILIETSLISLAGGSIGIVAAVVGIRLLELFGVDALPMSSSITFNGRSALAALLVSCGVGVLIATPIIWLHLRDRTNVRLQGETRGGTVSRSVQRLRHAFIITQLAIAFVLLCGAGMLSVSLKQTLDIPPGFEAEQILSAEVSLPWATYQTEQARLAVITRLVEKLQGLPGVEHAAASNSLPFRTGGTEPGRIRLEGFDPSSGETLRAHHITAVTPEYWKAMNIPLLQGRFFDYSSLQDKIDHISGEALIDQEVARQYWPNGNAIGEQLSIDPNWFIKDAPSTYTIVGIVGKVKQADLVEADTLGAVYVPFYTDARSFYLTIRGKNSSAAFKPAVERVIAGFSPELPAHDFQTMQSRIDNTLITRRSPAILAALFAFIALLLASIGIYGALTYAVAQRHREIGVRMALGARPQQITHHFMSLGRRLIILGSCLGCLGAWMAGRAMQSLLFDVPSIHLPTLISTALVIGLVTLLACLLPAKHASRIEPIEALRTE